MTAVGCVEGNPVAEPRARQLSLSAGLEWMWIAGDDVGDDAGCERNHVADNTRQQKAKHSKRDAAGIALEVRPEAEQVSPRRRFLWRRFRRARGSRAGWSCNVLGYRFRVRRRCRASAHFNSFSRPTNVKPTSAYRPSSAVPVENVRTCDRATDTASSADSSARRSEASGPDHRRL